jgi:hypothetical protein
MLLEEVLAVALSHAAKAEQCLAKLREKHRALAPVQGASSLAAEASAEIAHLEHGLIEIDAYVQTLRKRLAED